MTRALPTRTPAARALSPAASPIGPRRATSSESGTRLRAQREPASTGHELRDAPELDVDELPPDEAHMIATRAPTRRFEVSAELLESTRIAAAAEYGVPAPANLTPITRPSRQEPPRAPDLTDERVSAIVARERFSDVDSLPPLPPPIAIPTPRPRAAVHRRGRDRVARAPSNAAARITVFLLALLTSFVFLVIAAQPLVSALFTRILAR